MYPLTYVYNVQVHSSTKVTAFRLVFSCDQPRHTAGSAQRMLPDEHDATTPMDYRDWLIKQAALLKMLAAKNLKKAQAKYKMDHYRWVRFEPRLARGDFVFIECPELFASAAKLMASEGYHRRMPRRPGLYKIVCVGLEMLRIGQDGVRSTIAINRLTRVSQDKTRSEHSTRPTKSRTAVENLRWEQVDESQDESRTAICAAEKVADLVVTPSEIHHRIRWYGYHANDDIVNPPENIA